MDLDALRRSPNALAGYYRRFHVADRVLMNGHSHQAWPDVARDGQLDAFDDAAALTGAKWPRAEEKAERLRAGVRALLGEPAAEVALAGSTHDLLVRFLSCLDLSKRPRLVTTDAEFHSVRRQLGRFAEAGVWIDWVPAAPVHTLAERLAAATDDRTAAVLVSTVLFETSRLVPGLPLVAEAAARHGAELLLDAYHGLGVLPYDPAGLADAWVLGGGYKYLQLGEGNCFLRLPPHAARLRPVVTGWYAEPSAMNGVVSYGAGGQRFAGATYDPTSHYRAARVLDFFVAQGLSPVFLREVSLHQTGLLAAAVDELDLPPSVVTRDRSAPREAFGGFLTLSAPRAADLVRGLAARGVTADSRGRHLRLGPAPYLSDTQLRIAVDALSETVGELVSSSGK